MSLLLIFFKKPVKVTLSVEISGLGNWIKRTRESKRLTPTQVSALSGMSTTNLYRIEHEDAKSVPRETLKKLSDVLEVDFDAAVRQALIADFEEYQ